MSTMKNSEREDAFERHFLVKNTIYKDYDDLAFANTSSLYRSMQTLGTTRSKVQTIIDSHAFITVAITAKRAPIPVRTAFHSSDASMSEPAIAPVASH